MSSLRIVALNAYKSLSHTVPYLRQTGQFSKVGLITPEVLPAVPAALGGLFQIGERETRGESTFPLKEAVAVAEAKMQETIIKKASDLFIYLPLAVGAYQMGRAESNRERIYQALKTTLMFGAGYMGITNIGPGIGYYLQSLEAERIHQLINRKELVELLKTKNKAGMPQEFMQSLTNLKRGAEQQIGMFKRVSQGKNISASLVGDFYQGFKKLQTDFLAQAQKANLTQFKPNVSNSLNILKEGIASYQAPYIRFFRSLNPMMGYFLATTLVAIPLSKIAKRILVPDGVTNTEREKDIVQPQFLDAAWEILSNLKS